MRLPRLLTFAALLALVTLAPLPAGAQTDQRCFTETGQCISGRIRTFWEQNGGLPVFGFPIGPQKEEQIEGKALQVQRFERNRLELHPENKAPYDVLLGRLGADRLAQLGKDWQAYPKSSAQAGCRFFPETGHNVCGAILRTWRASGLEIDGKKGKTEAENLALFGLPLSDIVTETMADGQQRQVQWFERARFEVHPENQAPYDILLGLLGNEIRDGGAAATPPPSTADQCTDVKEPVSARIRPSKCVTKGTRLEIDIFGFQPNEEIGFWLTSPDGGIVGTTETLNIGPMGAVYNLPLNTSNVPAPGLWYFVFQGVSSGHQSIIYFKILGGSNDNGGNNGGAAIPPSQNATATPNRGGRGTTFVLTGRGFQPGEAVGVYATAPDRSVYGAPFQIQADDQGVAEATFTATSGVPPGVWAVTFEGVSSHAKAIAYFEVTQ